VTWVKWKLVLVFFEVVLISIQDRCTDYAECVTGLKIILDARDETTW
jgi:hypothetical protein